MYNKKEATQVSIHLPKNMCKSAQIKVPLKLSGALTDPGMANRHLFIVMKKPVSIDFPVGADHYFFFLFD